MRPPHGWGREAGVGSGRGAKRCLTKGSPPRLPSRVTPRHPRPAYALDPSHLHPSFSTAFIRHLHHRLDCRRRSLWLRALRSGRLSGRSPSRRRPWVLRAPGGNGPDSQRPGRRREPPPGQGFGRFPAARLPDASPPACGGWALPRRPPRPPLPRGASPPRGPAPWPSGVGA